MSPVPRSEIRDAREASKCLPRATLIESRRACFQEELATGGNSLPKELDQYSRSNSRCHAGKKSKASGSVINTTMP